MLPLLSDDWSISTDPAGASSAAMSIPCLAMQHIPLSSPLHAEGTKHLLHPHAAPALPAAPLCMVKDILTRAIW